MAANKVTGNPTQNLFSLLSDDAPEPSVVAAPKPAKKENAKKPAASENVPVGGVLTPAEKAKLREAKEAKAKAARRDAPQVDEKAAGPRGTGNRGARRAVNAEPHGHQPPKHGRAFDRQSGGITSRKPPAKKGGAGKGNWGDSVKDSVVDENEVKSEEKKSEEETVSEAPEVVVEDNTPTFEDYLKQKAAAQAALEAKVGVIQPRKLENVDLTGAVESKKILPAVQEAMSSAPAPKTEQPASRKGTKMVSVDEVFKVRIAPVGGEDRPRGGRGGRGGRGARGGRGGARNGEGAAAPRSGRGASRGGRGGRGRPLDPNNNRQFPSLGQ